MRERLHRYTNNIEKCYLHSTNLINGQQSLHETIIVWIYYTNQVPII